MAPKFDPLIPHNAILILRYAAQCRIMFKRYAEYTVKWRQRNFQLEQGTECYRIGKNVGQVGNLLTINIYIF
jgi:hypothetical protein